MTSHIARAWRCFSPALNKKKKNMKNFGAKYFPEFSQETKLNAQLSSYLTIQI